MFQIKEDKFKNIKFTFLTVGHLKSGHELPFLLLFFFIYGIIMFLHCDNIFMTSKNISPSNSNYCYGINVILIISHNTVMEMIQSQSFL